MRLGSLFKTMAVLRLLKNVNLISFSTLSAPVVQYTHTPACLVDERNLLVLTTAHAVYSLVMAWCRTDR